MSYLLPVSTIILILCSLILTVMELSPLLRESTGSSLLSSELFSSQSVPGLELKLRTFMGGFFSFPFLPFLWSALDFEQQTLGKCPTFFCSCYTWTWLRHIRQEHVRLFHHIGSSWKFFLVILEKRARGRSGPGFLWCLETAIALLVRPFLHSAQFSQFLPGQGPLAGAVSALRFGKSTSRQMVSCYLLLQSAKVAGFYQLSKARQVRVQRLVCLLCSRPEFVAFYYHVPFWGNVPIQGGLGFFDALVFARERVENALHGGAKAMQHRGSLNCILLFL